MGYLESSKNALALNEGPAHVERMKNWSDESEWKESFARGRNK